MAYLSEAIEAVDRLIRNHERSVKREAPRLAELPPDKLEVYVAASERQATALTTIRNYLLQPASMANYVRQSERAQWDTVQIAKHAANYMRQVINAYERDVGKPDEERAALRRAKERRAEIKATLAEMRDEGESITEILIRRPEWQIELWGEVRLRAADYEHAERNVENYWQNKRQVPTIHPQVMKSWTLR